MSSLMSAPKRLLLGSPLSNEQMGETLLPKRLALPVFCSDPLSSNAYATEEILLVLGTGGLAMLTMTPWIALAVITLLVVVVASYRQTCHAYPGGGGAYAVSKANLGRNAALVAASALLVDYVLTVAVSVAAGVANIVAAVPELAPHAVALCVGLIVALALVNLRGVKESGTAFAIPTYGFVASVFVMIGVGLVRTALGHPPVASSAGLPLAATSTLSPLLVVALALRAFASGCTALTGVEAVSNGVPSFRVPKSRNAAATLTAMAVLTIAMFVGITALAMITGVRMGDPATHPDQITVIAQLSAAVFGNASFGFYVVQVFTAAILVLAANTAFNGFPILASILGEDGFLGRQLARRGDRLVFSNGIIILATLAILLVVLFDASTTRLIQLYILGVFVSFTLSQAGMVRHWTDELTRTAESRARASLHRKRLINGLGAAVTALVLVIVLATKFTHGAWIVVIAMPATFWLMLAIRRHYDRVDTETTPAAGGVPLPSRVHGVVLVSRLNAPTLRALAFARATRPSTLVALNVRSNPAESDRLLHDWDARDIPVPLTVLDSRYRDTTRPALEYVSRIRRDSPRDIVVVFVPEYVVEHWWQQVLHNQTALRLKARLLYTPGVMMTSVPWIGGDTEGAAAVATPERVTV
ncbi:APC family permease [Cellulomonas citrea]|uniref:APC family permease n=1 Tax=Cellulomonas citrea TaxID=1909423 RepID=UPI0019158382|nr:APC family permease [Cellulomonas citrea]